MEHMNGEFFHGPLKNQAWLEQELTDVWESIDLEKGVSGVEAQLCRDLYIESITQNFSNIAESSYLELETNSEVVLYEPELETSMGLLCKYHKEENTVPERVLLCGTLYAVNPELRSVGWINLENYNFEDLIDKPEHITARYRGHDLFIAARQICTSGQLTLRRMILLEEAHTLQQSGKIPKGMTYAKLDAVIDGSPISYYIERPISISSETILGFRTYSESGSILTEASI